MNKEIFKKIDEAIASSETPEETKKLLQEVKEELKNAKTEKRIAQIMAILIRIITGFFDD